MTNIIGKIFEKHFEAAAKEFMAEARIFAAKNWIRLNKMDI